MITRSGRFRSCLGNRNFGTKPRGDASFDEMDVQPLTIRMAVIVFATVPILLVYPFLQKHFAKGVMLGSVKG